MQRCQNLSLYYGFQNFWKWMIKLNREYQWYNLNPKQRWQINELGLKFSISHIHWKQEPLYANLILSYRTTYAAFPCTWRIQISRSHVTLWLRSNVKLYVVPFEKHLQHEFLEAASDTARDQAVEEHYTLTYRESVEFLSKRSSAANRSIEETL